MREVTMSFGNFIVFLVLSERIFKIIEFTFSIKLIYDDDHGASC
jgi:hypothetical protein